MNRLSKSRLRWAWLAAALAAAGFTWAMFAWLNNRAAPPDNPAQAARITFIEPGIYALTYDHLRSLGWHSLDPAALALTYRGSPVPVYLQGEGPDLRLYFYGEALEDNPYTRENAYFLSPQGSPAAMPVLAPGEAAPALNAYTRSLHLEENQVYSPKTLENNTWYWQSLSARSTIPVEFTLDGVLDGAGTLTLSLFAATDSASADPDHHIRLSLNGTQVADHSWDGKGLQTLVTVLPPGTLINGTNLLEIETPGDTGVVVETALLDWFELSYERLPLYTGAQLHIPGRNGSFSLGGFDEVPLAFEITGPLETAVLPLAASPDRTYLLPAREGASYRVLSPGDALEPLQVAPAALTPGLRSPDFIGDYLAIGPAGLLEPLAPLLEHRAEQGLTPLAVPIQAVYDQFGDGLARPEAIRSFLQYALENWPAPPRFVLLVGDGSYDPRGYITTPEINRLPGFFVFTMHGGETVTDLPFVTPASGEFPALALGRIPARTTAQVTVLVNKTLSYEANLASVSPRVLAVADGQEASFQNDAETFLGYFSHAYTPDLLAPEAGSQSAAGEIEARLNEGLLFFSYFGHGSVTQLGKDSLFTTENGAALSNDSLPILINITCLAGFYAHPTVESLTETMLWNPDGGAVAALSATSLTTPDNQAFLSRAFVEALLANPDARLGEVLLRAQQALPLDNPAVREVMETFLLFGDPALQLPAP